VAVQRVSIVGVSGAGKSTTGRAIAEVLGVEFTELDSVFHRPGWTHPDDEEFRDLVRELAAGERWVIDGNYSAVRDLVWAKADAIVWLDPPRGVATARVLRRTLRRVTTRQELWNGNREHWTNLLRPDPEQNIVLWSWTRHPVYAERYGAAMEDPALDHAQRFRLRSDVQVELFLREVAAQHDRVGS
jgi:adenylate kinase family enzyme